MGNAKHTTVALIAVAMISSLTLKQVIDFKADNRLASILSNGTVTEEVASQTVITVSPEEAEQKLYETYTQEEIQEIIDKKSEPQVNYVILTGGVLDVYDSPSHECAPVDALNRCDEVRIEESTDEWYKVAYGDGKAGYVLKEKITDDKAKAEYAAMYYDNFKVAKVQTNGGDVNVRKSATKNSSVITQLGNDTAIVIESIEGEYTKICYGADYDTGYIITSSVVETDGWVLKTEVANVQKAAAERRAAEEAARKAKEKAEREARERAAKEKAEREAREKAAKSAASSSSSESSYTAPPTSIKGQAIVNEAKKYLGVKYVYGGSSPRGFDCSGLVQYVCRTLGISVNRTAAAQFGNGRAVKKSDLQPGDLVFFAKNGRIHHVGIYAGNGQMIHAPQTGDVVRYASLNSSYRVNGYAGARRVY